MNKQKNKAVGMFVKVATFVSIVTMVVPSRILADAQCAYNICPKDTSIIFQDGNIAITDVQVAALAVVLIVGVLLIVNGKKIKANLIK